MTRHPTVDLVASYTHSDNSDYSKGAVSDVAAIGIQLSLPLYTGGLTSSRTQEARYNYQSAYESLEQQRRATARETRAAYLNLMSGISQVQALGQSVTSNETALRATEAGLEVGTRTTVEVLNAQSKLFSAKRDYAQARYNAILAALSLKLAAGSLEQADLEAVNQELTP